MKRAAAFSSSSLLLIHLIMARWFYMFVRCVADVSLVHVGTERSSGSKVLQSRWTITLYLTIKLYIHYVLGTFSMYWVHVLPFVCSNQQDRKPFSFSTLESCLLLVSLSTPNFLMQSEPCCGAHAPLCLWAFFWEFSFIVISCLSSPEA